MIDEMRRDQIEEISESVLDDHSSEVATTISGYIAKKLLKRSKCKDYEMKLTVHDQYLQNDQYLTLLSRGGLFLPKKELAEFVISCFAIYLFIYFSFLININLMEKNNYKLTIALYKLN